MTAKGSTCSVRFYSALVESEDDRQTSHFLLNQSLKLAGRGRLYRRGMRPGTWLSKYLKKRTEFSVIKLSVLFDAYILQRKFHYVFLFWELHGLIQSQFPQSYVCERFIYS
jgi:hypothetical protein